MGNEILNEEGANAFEEVRQTFAALKQKWPLLEISATIYCPVMDAHTTVYGDSYTSAHGLP